MRAIAVMPGEQRIDVVDHPAPAMQQPTDVRLRMRAVGMCGTDREIAEFAYGQPPVGENYLVVGHESLGEIIEVGDRVTDLKTGDLAVVMVRRPCDRPDCAACRAGRADFCYTGAFTERGIRHAHGFMTEQVVDEAQYVVPIPKSLGGLGVLVEPLTIAEKALLQVYDIQERLPWSCAVRPGKPRNYCHRALVLGAGPVGLLGAMRLRDAGFETFVYSKEHADSDKAQITESIDAVYLSAQDTTIDQLTHRVGHMDLVYEATGAARISFEVLAQLGTNGVFCFTGVPGRKAPIELDADTIMRRLVLRNQVVFGTVNAGRPAYEAAARSLTRMLERWPDALQQLITAYHTPEEAVELLRHGWRGIKHVVRFDT